MSKLENTLTNNVVIDGDTGEYLGYLTHKEVKVLKNMRTSINGSGAKFKRKDDLFAEYIRKNFGSFFFNFYNNTIDKEYIFRFIYLCTYCNYKNYIVLGEQSGEGKLATKKDIKEILNLKDQQFYNTYNYLLKNEMIEEVEGHIKISDKYYKRGKINKVEIKKGVARMFDASIKELYNKSKSSEHEKLGLLIKILPYLSYSMNILCKNPEERNRELIEPLTLTELTEILGYSSRQRLKRSLFDLKVNNKKVIMIAKFDTIDMIAINPAIYYKCNDIKSLQLLVDMFKIADRY